MFALYARTFAVSIALLAIGGRIVVAQAQPASRAAAPTKMLQRPSTGKPDIASSGMRLKAITVSAKPASL